MGVFIIFISIDTCIDQYKESRKANIDDADIPSGIRSIVDFIFSQSLINNDISNLLGISIECNRLDLLDKALRSSSSIRSSLYSVLHLIQEFNYSEDVKTKVLTLLQPLFVEEGDRFGVFLCLLYLHNQADCTCFSILSLVIKLLIQCSQEDVESAYQMAFFLYELADVKFCYSITHAFPQEELQNKNSPLFKMQQILLGTVSTDL